MGTEEEWLQTAPPAQWAKATTRIPQIIAHRGYKAKYAENSMKAMQAAVEAGAVALETDVHLTADGVVVLSHDPTLKRCFGRDEKISDVLWEDVAKLKSVSDPEVGMARLVDLLDWLKSPGRQRIWVLLDIKIDDDADELLTAIGDAFDSVPSAWTQRIILGCWNATFIKAARRILPAYSLAHISYSLYYSQHFSSLPNLGFNIVYPRIGFPFAGWFLRNAQKSDRPLFVWTVNDKYWMEWCLRQNQHVQEGQKMVIDGIITDDPIELVGVIERSQDGRQHSSTVREVVRRWWQLCLLNVVASVIFLVRRYSHGKMDYLHEAK